MIGSTITKLRNFSKIPRNIAARELSPSYSTVGSLSGSGQSHVVTLFDEMPQWVPDKRSSLLGRVLSLVRASSFHGDATFPSKVHCLALKVGAVSHLPVLTSLVMAYSRARELSHSRCLFDEIIDKDVIVYNAMITSLVDHGCYEEAMDFFLKMLSCHMGFSSTTLLLMVSALASSGSLVQGRILHGIALKSGSLSDSSLNNALIDMYAKLGDLLSSELVFYEMGSFRDTVSWNSVASGCLRGNDPERCLLYFQMRSCHGEKGDSASLSSAISAASSLRELRWGQVLHALSSKIGLDNNPCNNSVANSLVSLYSTTGQIVAAEFIFRETFFKDTVSWNTVIEGLRSNGEIEAAFQLLHEMQFTAKLLPDKITLLTITSICADEMLLGEGRAVHGCILRGGMELDSSLINSLIYMYAKCSCSECAHYLFEFMIPRRDPISWNTMISGYTQGGLNEVAQNLFREMLKNSVECGAATFLAVLPSCNSSEFLRFGKSIHSRMLKSGFSNDNVVLNSLIYMYINFGELKTAFLLFWSDSDKEDTTSWNTVIGGCEQNGYFGKSLDTFRAMMREGNARFDFITILSALSACGNLELVSGGKLIHGLIVKSQLGSEIRVLNAIISMYGRCGEIESAIAVFTTGSNLNLCSWNCMISAYCQNKNPVGALNLFCHLDLEPDDFTISGIITACSQVGSLTHGKQIHAHVLRCSLNENPVICSALLDMYSNCGRLDFAGRVFRELPNKSVVAWNSMISAYGYHSNGKKAVELFQEMCRCGHRPNNGTFTGLLSACSHSGLVTEGLYYYHLMFKDFGIKPVADHRVCIVDMLGRSGDLLEAYRFIAEMAPIPESGPLGALLSWCNFYGDINLAREVGEMLFKLDPENPGYYISLSNMYVFAGRWKEAIELRDMVDEKRLKKPPGYSLIDIGSVQ